MSKYIHVADHKLREFPNLACFNNCNTYPISIDGHVGEVLYNNPLSAHIIRSITHRKQEPQDKGENDLFEDRLHLIRSKIELIIMQIDERKKINRDITYRIDQDSCRAYSLYLDMGPQGYELSGNKLALEKMRFDLERQRRSEQSSYFNDTAFLNRDLRDTLIQYMDEVIKNQLMSEEDEL